MKAAILVVALLAIVAAGAFAAYAAAYSLRRRASARALPAWWARPIRTAGLERAFLCASCSGPSTNATGGRCAARGRDSITRV